MAETPLHTWKPFDIYKARTTDKTFTIYKANGNAFALALSDVVRFKLWKHPSGDASAPDLDIDSAAASSNGSVITIDVAGTDDTTAAQVTVRFAQGDTSSLDSQEYRGELAQVDDSETSPTDAIKVIAEGPVNVVGRAAGDVGKT